MPRVRLRTSSRYISTALFISDTTPPRIHAKWSFLRFLTFLHLLLQVNCQRNQISPSPLTNCVNYLHPRLNHTIGYCTSCLLSFATTVNTLTVTTSVTDGSLDRSVLDPCASLRLNSLAHRFADVSGAHSSGLSESTTATTIGGGRVMVGYELAIIRFRKSTLTQWPLKVPPSSCFSTRKFYSRRHPPRVSRWSRDLKEASDPKARNLRDLNLVKVIPGYGARFPAPEQMMCSPESLETSSLDGQRAPHHSQRRYPQVRRSQHFR